jgi:hypothetical protein
MSFGTLQRMKIMAHATAVTDAIIAALADNVEMDGMYEKALLKYGFWREIQGKEVDICSDCEGCGACGGGGGNYV